MAIISLLLSWLPESLTTRAILIGLAVGLLVYYMTKKRYKLPPGPRGLPLIGNILSLRKGVLYRKLVEWKKDYGPIITIRFGPMPIVFLNRLDVIQEALSKQSTTFAGRPWIYSVDRFTEGGKDIIFTNYGPTWQLHRRLALNALKYYMKGNRFEESLREVLELGIAEIKKEKEAFDIKIKIELIVFNLISKICFGEKFAPDDKEYLRFCEIINVQTEEFGTGFWEDIIPPLRLYPTKKFRKLFGMTEESLAFIKKRVNQHKATFSPDKQRDFTDAIFLAQKEAEDEENPELLAQITDVHVAQTVSDIFEAGIDTSRQTLYWTVLYLTANPDIQAKVHEELDSVMGDRTTPLLSDRDKIPYTSAVLSESMRLSTVAVFAAPHRTICDTTLCGYDLPKGTMIMPNLYAVHHDPRHWDEPDKFKPERFLDASGKLLPKPESWMPFSIGRRACLAESMAKPELLLLLAGLVKNFEIRMPEGVTANTAAKEENFVYIPHPYKVVVKERVPC